MRRYLVLWLFFAVAAAACNSRGKLPPTPMPTGVSPSPTPTAVAAPPATLRIWLPDTIAPRVNAHAYEILEKRLQAFASAHNITVDIRIKPVEGTAGMLTALNAARMVAPDAVPDLVLMPKNTLEAAAVKGLAFPLTEAAFATPLSADDWFPYARQMATLQGVIYGVPFSGDALGLLYHPKAVPAPPATWNDWLQISQPWLLPLGDTQATALLALYRAAGGAWEDKNGRPALDEAALRQTLTLLQQAVQNHRLNASLLGVTGDSVLWERYQGNVQALMITRISHLLPGPDPRRMAPLPAAEHSKPLALADGLLWVLTTPAQNRQLLAMSLLVDLGKPEFVAQWTEAAGYLPPRQSCLNAWESADHRAIAAALLPFLQPGPSQQVVTVLGPVLQKAAAQVISGEQSPASAAQWAVSTVANGG